MTTECLGLAVVYSSHLIVQLNTLNISVLLSALVVVGVCIVACVLASDKKGQIRKKWNLRGEWGLCFL